MIGKVRPIDGDGFTFEATEDGRVMHCAGGKVVWVVNISMAETIAERLDAVITAAYGLRVIPDAAPPVYRSVNQHDQE